MHSAGVALPGFNGLRDVLEDFSSGRADAARVEVGPAFTRLAARAPLRLGVLTETDAARTHHVCIASPDAQRAAYIERGAGGRGNEFFALDDGDVFTPLHTLGARLELSGRAGGGVYFRAVAFRPRHVITRAGRKVAWRPEHSRWLRLAPQFEGEVLP